MVKSLARKEDSPPALNVIICAINSQSNFSDESTPCVTCSEPKAIKKCSKCKAVQYCDRECQRLHWFVHKKECARSSTSNVLKEKNSEGTPERNTEELSSNVENLEITATNSWVLRDVLTRHWSRIPHLESWMRCVALHSFFSFSVVCESICVCIQRRLSLCLIFFLHFVL